MQNPPLGESTNQNRIKHSLDQSNKACKSKINTNMRFKPHMEVLYVDVLVRSRLSLTPEQQSFFSRGFYRETQQKQSLSLFAFLL